MLRTISVLLILGIFLGSLLGLARLEVDLSYEDFFPEDALERLTLQRHHDRWGPDDRVLSVVVSRWDDAPLWSEEGLRQLVRLSQLLRANDAVHAVRSITNQPLMVGAGLAPEGPERPLERLTRQRRYLDGAQAVFPSIEQRLQRGQRPPPGGWATALQEQPGARPFFLSEDGRFAALHVVLTPSGAAALPEALDTLDQTLTSFSGDSSLDVRLAGARVMHAEVMRLLVGDLLRLLPMAALLMAALLWLGTRSVRSALGPSVAAVLSMLAVAGVLGWLGRPLGLLNQVLLTVTPALVIADGLHLVHRYGVERSAGHPPIEALRITLRALGPAVLLTSMTSALAFLCLLTADLPLVREFAVPAAGAATVACLLALTVVPLALLILDPVWRPPPGGRHRARPVRAMLGRRHLIVGAAALLGVVCAAQVGILHNRSSLAELLGPDNPARVATDLLDRHLGGSIAFILTMEGDLRQRPVVEAIQHLDEALERDPRVRMVASPGKLIAFAERAVYGAEAPSGVVSARLLDGLRGVGASVVMDEYGSAWRMLVFTADMEPLAFAELGRDAAALAKVHLDPVGVRSEITGSAMLSYQGLEALSNDLRGGLVSAGVAVFGLLFLVFPQPRVAVCVILANTAPFLLGFAALSASPFSMSPGPAMVFAIGLGLCVDDTIHLLVRAWEGQARDLPLNDALAHAVASAAQPMVLTSLVLAVAFAVFLASTFPMLQAAGLVGVVIVLAALVADLILLPCLLHITLGPRGRIRSPVLNLCAGVTP
ncbi:MAG: MMPL family transporter [Alphaproteobacteria bacterium]|nr:MMPL family transporter [Polyangiaceae bacterium]MCB9764774.1 MMPL family transporter [Alphaproteobacteria bacterium]